MPLDRHTRKLYNEHPWLRSARTRVTKIGPDTVELAATVAFPEGGGQESDQGHIALDDGRIVRFIHARKIYGELAGLPGFPDLQVGGVIWHQVHPEDLPLLHDMEAGQSATVCIDVERRARLSLSHSASHLLYAAVLAQRPEALGATLGCHIKEGAARFDFALEARFTPEDLEAIARRSNDLVTRDVPIELRNHPGIPDARTWHCDGLAIPCGGTHIERTGAIGPIVVKRKGLGAGKERIGCEFPQALIMTDRYHDE